MRRALPVLVLVSGFVLGGCGQDAADDPGPDTGDGSATATSITIEVRSDTDAEPSRLTLRCDPAGGDHPQPQEACDALASAGPDVLEPVPADQPCTLIYGGPQTATVRGTIDGADVDASFSRENGCEIDRWERLGTTFFDVPLQ